jgi:hypothetical protein
MARTIDIPKLKAGSVRALHAARSRILYFGEPSFLQEAQLLKWICAMTTVEMHKVWERYVERRFAAALNHDANHFIKREEIKGVSHVSSGLAFYIVMGGDRYFDISSMSDLLSRGDRLLGHANNPFRALSPFEPSIP